MSIWITERQLPSSLPGHTSHTRVQRISSGYHFVTYLVYGIPEKLTYRALGCGPLIMTSTLTIALRPLFSRDVAFSPSQLAQFG